MTIYIYVLCNTTYFLTFPEVAIVRCSRKYLFLKYGRKMRLQYFFRGLPMLMASSLRQVLQTYSEIQFFCSAIQYIKGPKTASGKCTWSIDRLFRNCLWWSSYYSWLAEFPPIPSPPQVHHSPKWVICSLLSQTEELPKLLSSRHIRKSLSLYLSSILKHG